MVRQLLHIRIRKHYQILVHNLYPYLKQDLQTRHVELSNTESKQKSECKCVSVWRANLKKKLASEKQHFSKNFFNFLNYSVIASMNGYYYKAKNNNKISRNHLFRLVVKGIFFIHQFFEVFFLKI